MTIKEAERIAHLACAAWVKELSPEQTLAYGMALADYELREATAAVAALLGNPEQRWCITPPQIIGHILETRRRAAKVSDVASNLIGRVARYNRELYPTISIDRGTGMENYVTEQLTGGKGNERKPYLYMRSTREQVREWSSKQEQLGNVHCIFTTRDGEHVRKWNAQSDSYFDGRTWWPKMEFVLRWLDPALVTREMKSHLGIEEVHELVGNRELMAKYNQLKDLLLEAAIEEAKDHAITKHRGASFDTQGFTS